MFIDHLGINRHLYLNTPFAGVRRAGVVPTCYGGLYAVWVSNLHVLQDKSLHRLGHLTLGVLITCGLGLSTCLALFVNKGVLGS